MSGSQSGLWARLQAECKLNLITQWCVGNRASLAFKVVTNTVVEIKILMTDAVSVASYFRVSGKRTQELQKVASELNPPVELLAWPQYKEVRMVEFVAQLLRALARNIRACLELWSKVSGVDEEERLLRSGFSKTWIFSKLQLLFLYLDACEIFSRLSWRFQRNQLTTLDVGRAREVAITELEQMFTSPVPGGWEELFLSNSNEDSLHYSVMTYRGNVLIVYIMLLPQLEEISMLIESSY